MTIRVQTSLLTMLAGAALAGSALAAPPPAKPMAGADLTLDTLKFAAGVRDLQEVGLYIDHEQKLYKSMVVHMDPSVIPAEQHQRSARMRPGGDVTDYKWLFTFGRVWDYIGLRTEWGGRCELHTAQDGSDAFEECVVAHSDVPAKFMDQAKGLVEGGEPTKSKLVVHDKQGGMTTHELEVRGKDGYTAKLYVQPNGTENLRWFEVAPQSMPAAIRKVLDERVPEAKVISVKRRTSPVRANDWDIEVQRGKSTHALLFNEKGELRRHKYKVPAFIEFETFEAEGEPDAPRPY